MEKERILKGVSLLILGVIAIGSRLLSLQGKELSSVSFSTINGYETAAYAQHFAEGALSFPAKVGSGGEGVVASTRFAYEIGIGLLSYIGGGSLETTAILLKVVGPVFFAVAVLGIVFVTKNLTESFTAGLLSGVLFSVFPGTLLQQTTATAGTTLAFELAVIVWFLYFLQQFYTTIEENYILISEVDVELLRKEPSSVYLLLLPAVGVIGAFTSVSVGLVLLTLLFMSLLGITFLWESEREAYDEVILGSVSASSVIAIFVGLSIVVAGGVSTISEYSILLLLVLFALVLSVIGLVSNLYGPDRKLALLEGVIGVGYLVGISVLFFGQETVAGYFTSTLPYVQSYLLEFGPLWSQSTPIEDLYVSEFGLVAYLGFIGLCAFLYNWYTEENDWVSTQNIIATSMALTLIVFHIGSTEFLPLFAIFVSVFSAYLIYTIGTVFDLDTFSVSRQDILSRKVLVVVFVALLLVPSLVIPVAEDSGNIVTESQQTIQLVGDSNEVIGFISENTDDGDRVLTWGQSQSVIIESQTGVHTTSNTIDSAQRTAEVLTSSSEQATQGSEYIVLSGSQVTGTGDYSSMAEVSTNSRNDHIQYVFSSGSGQFAFSSHKQPYYNSLATRLYLYHGQAFAGGNVSQTYVERNGEYFTRPPEDIAQQKHIQKFDSQESLQEYLDEESEADITKKQGGIGVHPPERVPALSNHRYVYSESSSVLQNPQFSQHIRQYQDFSDGLETRDFVLDPANTKVFQQVPGKQITIENMPPQSTAQVFITLENSQTGTPLRYIATTQSDDQGVGQITVPYATQDIPESYSVRPAEHDEYEIIVRTQTLSTSEGSSQVTPQIEVRHASVPVTNEEVTTGTQETVTLEQISQEEYQQILQRQQPEQLQNQSGSTSEDDTSDESSTDP